MIDTTPVAPAISEEGRRLLADVFRTHILGINVQKGCAARSALEAYIGTLEEWRRATQADDLHRCEGCDRLTPKPLLRWDSCPECRATPPEQDGP